MTPKRGTRFVAYIRVSTEEQAREGVSLEAQRRRVMAWAELQEVGLVEILSDEGLSGSTLERPGLQRALAMLRAGEVDGLVVCKLDRLTRSTRDLLALVAELFEDGSRALASIAESVDTTTAAGRLVLTVLGALATWERETIAERTSEALRHLSAQGVKMGREGYGWRYTEAQGPEGRRVIEEVSSELRAAERAAALRAEGLSLRAIADRLTLEGVTTKRGGRWHAKTVRSLIEAA